MSACSSTILGNLSLQKYKCVVILRAPLVNQSSNVASSHQCAVQCFNLNSKMTLTLLYTQKILKTYVLCWLWPLTLQSHRLLTYYYGRTFLELRDFCLSDFQTFQCPTPYVRRSTTLEWLLRKRRDRTSLVWQRTYTARCAGKKKIGMHSYVKIVRSTALCNISKLGETWTGESVTSCCQR